MSNNTTSEEPSVVDDDNYDFSTTTDPGPPLGGNSLEVINAVGIVCIASLVGMVVVGRLVDVWCTRKKGKKFTCRGWVLLLLLTCYGFLVPGLIGCLFSFNIMVSALGMIKVGVGPEGGLNQFPPTTESMLGLIHLLATTGSMVGAFAVVFYAIVIPATKLILMVLGEGVIFKRQIPICIQVVQNISKWACPDMFAYILLCYLVRGLDHPPMLLARMRLDTGFTCFSLFCIGSTVASLGIRTKDREHKRSCWRIFVKKVGVEYLVYPVMALLVAFFVLFVFGLHTPVMALRVDLDSLYQPNGPLPNEIFGMPLKPIVEQLGIAELAAADVTVSEATKELWVWTMDGEVNGFIGFAMMALFVIVFTAADMLLLAACCVCIRAGYSAKGPMLMSWYLKKLGMLDVLIVGVVVVTLCMLMYRSDGIIVSCCTGLVELFAAEVIHYITYYTVKAAVESTEKRLAYDVGSETSEASSGVGEGFEEAVQSEGTVE